MCRTTLPIPTAEARHRRTGIQRLAALASPKGAWRRCQHVIGLKRSGFCKPEFGCDSNLNYIYVLYLHCWRGNVVLRFNAKSKNGECHVEQAENKNEPSRIASQQVERDDAQRCLTIRKHGVNFEDANMIFDGRLVLHAYSNQKGEERWIAVGNLEGLIISVIYTYRSKKSDSSLSVRPTIGNGSITMKNLVGATTRPKCEGKTNRERLRREEAAGLEPVCDDDEGEFDWSRAQVTMPRPKQAVSLRLDADVLEFFKASGKGYQTRINMVLRSYMKAEQAS